MWTFSKHILIRMDERRFSEKEILEIVNENVPVIIIPSSKDKLIDLYFAKVGIKYIFVVVNKETKNLVTVRNMRKSEIKSYNEEYENE